MSPEVRRLELTAATLPAAVDAVRAAGAKVATNWFLSPLEQLGRAFATDASLVFFDREEGLERLYYVTTDPADLSRALREAGARAAVCDHFGRAEIDPALGRALEAAELRPVARYLRIRRTRRGGRAGARDVAHATLDDLDALRRRLAEDFDAAVDYVPGARALAELIRERRVIVRRSTAIDGYLVYRVEGRSVRWDFIGTRPGAPAAVASALLADFEVDLAALGADVVTGWVDARRTALIAAYGAAGYRPDGLVRTTFLADASFRPRARASPAAAVAPVASPPEDGARPLVMAALAAVNAATPAAMRIALDDGASLEPLDSLALMNLLVGIEQAIFDALGVEVGITQAASLALDAGPARGSTVGGLVAFVEARLADARR